MFDHFFPFILCKIYKMYCMHEVKEDYTFVSLLCETFFLINYY